MFDEFLMYWLLWIMVIIIYFFMNSGRKRTILLIWVLSVISASNIYAEVSNIEISLSLIIILIGSFILTAEPSLSFLQLCKAFILMMVYCTVLIWEMVAPVWFFLPSYFIIPVILVFLAILLNKKIDEIFGFLLLGITLGQILFDTLLFVYHIHNQIGMTYYFIHICLSVLLLICIRFGLLITASITNFLNRKLI